VALRRSTRSGAPATWKRYRSYLSAMFRRAMRDGHLTSNPVPDVPQLYGSVAY
jgi:hypothetical protein